MSHRLTENPKEALILSDAQRQLSPPPNSHLGADGEQCTDSHLVSSQTQKSLFAK